MKQFRATASVKKGDFKALTTHVETGKRKGCGIHCQKAEEYLLCPVCKVFVWHKSCANELCVQLRISKPDFESDVWKYPNCSKS